MMIRRVRSGSLFRKYALLFAGLVGVVLTAQGAIETTFLYSKQRDLIAKVQREQSLAAAGKIEQFIAGIQTQVGWMTHLPWRPEDVEQRRFDALRLLRQVPAITDVALIDPGGFERLRVSRIAIDTVAADADLSADPRFTEAQRNKVYYGPVYFRRDSEPYITIALRGPRGTEGISVAEVNLKFIWDVVSSIRVGRSGKAYVTDAKGRLIAHPDISRVLRQSDYARLPYVREVIARPGPRLEAEAETVRDFDGRAVLMASTRIDPLDWILFVEAPLDEVYAPLYSSLGWTAVLLLVGLAVAVCAATIFARRMVVPIEALRVGAMRIGDGDLDHRVTVSTGDELELLGEQFNRMARELIDWREKNKRLDGFRRFLAPQIANVIASGDDALLNSHRSEITVAFGDLRGFTPFSEKSEPEEVMGVLREYHAALGRIIFAYEGTLERFLGDGFMVFFNDPFPCADPERRAASMAVEMRREVSALSETWRSRGHALDFGMGVAQGFATLGRVGFEGRFEYSAIGNVANLASRLCSEAAGGQILVSQSVVDALGGAFDVESVGPLALKGFSRPMAVYNVVGRLEG